MTADDVAAGLLWFTLTVYAVTGGADFGGGFWDLIGGAGQKGARARRLIDASITPVWEANHVWLIIVLVILWTAFPAVFAAIMTTLFVPLTLVVFGIVLRGSGFVFRKTITGARLQRVMGEVFALSSVVTPFFMGTCAGAIVTGRVTARSTSHELSDWTSSTCLFVGVLSVLAFAFLAAVYLRAEARLRGDAQMEVYFSHRAMISGILAAIAGGTVLVLLHNSARRAFDNLGHGAALGLFSISALLGVAAIILVALGVKVSRPAAAAAFAFALWAWAVAQYPQMLPGYLTISAGAAPSSSLVTEMVVFGAIVVLVVPSFVLLYWLSQRGVLREVEQK